MNRDKRAIGGSSQRLSGEHGATVEMAVILALTPAGARKDFGQLARELALPANQSTLAACVSLSSDGWIVRNENNGRYRLTSRALEMLAASKRHQRKQRPARRAA
jgi:DNA-binding IclR family transcriptional regulator